MILPEHRGGKKLVYEGDLLVLLVMLVRVLLSVPLLLSLLLVVVVADVGVGAGVGVAIATRPLLHGKGKGTELLLSLKLPCFGANLMFPQMQKIWEGRGCRELTLAARNW